jgi:WD40 repeat protein
LTSRPGVTTELIQQIEQLSTRPPVGLAAIALSPGGDLAATCRHGQRQVDLWHLDTGRRVAVLEVDAGATALDFSGDGALLATGDAEGNVVLWDVATWSRRGLLPCYPAPPSVDRGVLDVRFSPDSSILAASRHERIELWQPASGAALGNLEGNIHEDWREVAFSPDGRTLAAAQQGKTAVAWDLATRRQLDTLTASDELESVSFSPDGQTLATGSLDGNVQLWDLRTGQEMVTMETGLRHAYSVAFSPVGWQLAAAGPPDGNHGELYTFSGTETKLRGSAP